MPVFGEFAKLSQSDCAVPSFVTIGIRVSGVRSPVPLAFRPRGFRPEIRGEIYIDFIIK